MALIWFLLVDVKGKQLIESTDAVSLDHSLLIVQIRDAVKAKFADSLLQSIAPANLKVYENRQAFDSRKSVDEKEKRDDWWKDLVYRWLLVENECEKPGVSFFDWFTKILIYSSDLRKYSF